MLPMGNKSEGQLALVARIDPADVDGEEVDGDDSPETRRDHEADLTAPGLAVDLAIALDELLVEPPTAMYAPFAGSGIFGQVAAVLWPGCRRYGSDLRATETGGGHFHRFSAGAPAEFVIRRRGLLRSGDLGEVDLVLDNPAFSRAFSRHDGSGRRRRDRECALDMLATHMPGAVVAFLGPTQWGQRGDGPAILRDHPLAHQLRATAPAACRGGSGTDSDDYSLLVWGPRERFRVTGPEGGWRCVNVPARSIIGRCYRWERGRPGDAPLSSVLRQRLDAARNHR